MSSPSTSTFSQDAPTSGTTAPASAPRVLVVDDDPQIRRSLQLTLEDEGLAVDTAGDGDEALRRAAQRTPALVILDMGLPLRDGAGVANELRATCGEGLPILLITADGRAAEKAARVRAFAYLHKPFELNELIDLMQRRLAP